MKLTDDQFKAAILLFLNPGRLLDHESLYHQFEDMIDYEASLRGLENWHNAYDTYFRAGAF